ncbi:MAG TPA: IS4 family transposase, partial [Terracidiphilus sp.]|nr:IS4 family transposase [Terracidiphilus sp.]HWG19653.1 IS4 family transposase [Terracidiphilus sp.]
QILQVLSLTLFEKTPILRALQSVDSQLDLPCPDNQLNLFNL